MVTQKMDPRIRECLRLRLVVVGLPHSYINPFLGLVSGWLDHNGIEWTISRLKSLKVDLLRHKSCLPPITWIKRNSKGGIHGVIGGIFHWAEKSDKTFSKAIQVFMIYSWWVYQEVTEKQMEKFKSGVCAPPSDLGNIPESLGNFVKTFGFYKGRKLAMPDPLVTYEGSSSKRAPQQFGRPSLSQDVAILNDLTIFNSNEGVSLYKKYSDIFDSLLTGLDRKEYLQDLKKHSHPLNRNDVSQIDVGKIAFIQEPGGKLRSVANPFRIFQEALKPLGYHLYHTLKQLPWDCTFRQSAAFEPVRYALEQGVPVYSVDLSSATDYFPLEIQSAVVRSLVPKESHHHIDLWIDLCKGVWKLPKGDKISWRRGQPLGMFPSFAAFAASHGFLLLWLLKKRSGGLKYNDHWNGEFFVLGDDVVILDHQLYREYMRILDLIGCPYSVEKTLSSSKVAEFAGKIITPSGDYPQMKWRQFSDDNFLDLCKLLGPTSRILLRARQKKVFDHVKHLLPPIGINISLPGDDYGKALLRTMDSPLYNPEKVVLKSLMGLRRRLNRNLGYISSFEATNTDELREITSTFDVKVKEAMKKTVVSRWETMISLISGFASLPEAIGVEPKLPLEITMPTKTSLLERYERILMTNT